MNLEGKIDLIKSSVADIKQAILDKDVTPSGNLSTYADAIDNIVTPNNQSKTVTSNGVVRYDEGYTGLEQVTINVNQSVQDKTITNNGTYTADNGYIGLGTVTVNVSPSVSTKTITANGIYNAEDDNVDGYSNVTVNVPIPKINYIVRNNVLENLKYTDNSLMSLSEQTISSKSLDSVYKDDISVNTVYLSNLTTISNDVAMQNAFSGCTNLTSVDLSSLTTVSGSKVMQFAFRNCTGLTSLNLSSLTTVSGSQAMSNAFYGCTGLTNVDLSSLTTLSGTSAMYYAFRNCTGLTSLNLSSLTTVSEYAMTYMFKNTSLETLSFPSLKSNSFGNYTNQFNNMLADVTGCTVHFPSNLQAVIGSWSDVQEGFGGTNTTVLFDLPATT